MTTAQEERSQAGHPTVSQLRHRAEVPALVGAGILSVIGLVVTVALAIRGLDIPAWASASVVGLITPVAAGVVFIRYFYWKEIVNGVEITESQLPEIYTIYADLVDQMDINPMPRLYLGNGDGALNAFASKCQIRRHYVVVWSDLLDIAYEHGDFDGVKFVLAHELGHVKCGHVDLWRQAVMAVPRVLFLGRTVTRAQEYTADRCGAYYAPEGAKSIMVLFAGKRMYRHCNLEAHQASIANHKDGFWMKFSNFMSSHAIGMRRIGPLANIEEDGWDQHGKML